MPRVRKDELEIGGTERAFAWFIEDDLRLATGANSGMISQPGSPRTRIRPQGPWSPIPAPIRRERQRLFSGRSDRVRPMALTGVDDVETACRMALRTLRIGSIGARVSERS